MLFRSAIERGKYEGRWPRVELTTEGVTPLWIAAENGNAEIARLLVQAGGDPWIIRKHDIEKMYDEYDRQIKTPPKWSERTAVWIALEKKNYNILQVFAEEGIDFNKPCYGGKTPIQLAAEKGDKEALRIMIGG